MKKLTLLFILSWSLFSCQPSEKNITEPVTIIKTKKVLVENFTGVRCIACPSGINALEDLSDLHDGDLIIVSIYSSDFSEPHSSSQHDFRTTSGEEIIDFIGRLVGYPSAVINRKNHTTDNDDLPIFKPLWAGVISQELLETPKLNVNILNDFNTSTRELSVQVTGIAQEDIMSNLSLTIVITEDNIEAPQEVDTLGVVEDYIHNYVFRTTMTASTGDNFTSGLVSGDSYEENYSMILPEEWNAENCKVVAFVSMNNGTDKEVLQVNSHPVEN